MRSRALVVGIGLAMILTACQEGTEQSTTTTSDLLPVVVDPDWECYYLEGVIALQAEPGGVGVVEEAAVDALDDFGTATAINAIDILDDEITPENIDQVSVNIDAVLGLVRTSLDPLRASIYLQSREPSIIASPVHAVGLAAHWQFKPGTDPEPIAGELPTVDNGTGPFVAVIDSGFVPDGPAWNDDPNVAYDPFDIEPDPGLASHGTFVSGLIRQLSPDNRVSMARAPFVLEDRFITRGEEEEPLQVALSSELHVFEALERLIMRHSQSQDVRALNMSLGTYACDPGEDGLLVTLVAALQRWDTEIGAESFAAGGNEVYPAPFWPGALDNVRAVGAANQTGHQIVWVNNDEELAGPRYWVDDVAPGSKLVGLATPGNAAETELVAWSGSSFATAVAAALYARGDNPVRDSGLDWWPNASADYDAVSGLSYTTDPLTQPVKTIP